MIFLKNISKQYAGRTILDDISATFSGKRIALVGANGSGKTTILKIIAGAEHQDSGEIITKKNLSLEYLPQETAYTFTGTIFSEAEKFGENKDIEYLKLQEESLLEKIKESDDPLLIERLFLVQEKIMSSEVKSKKENRIETVLLNLGFERELWDTPAKNLSGGWQMRLALARVLIKEPEAILLDEPTNYLDIESIRYLSSWLKNYAGMLLFVAHDRRFINILSEEIWDIFSGKLTIYKGNYEFYLEEKEKNMSSLEKKREKQLREIDTLQKYVDKFRYNANTASLAQSRLKQLEKIKEDLVSLPEKSRSLSFSLPKPKRGGNIVCDISDIHFSYGENKIISGYKRIITRKEKIALVGRNGIGKSTLMNLIGGSLNPLSGELSLGKDIDLSYLRQNETESLPKDKTVLEFVEQSAPLDFFSKVKSILGSFLFFEDSWEKKIAVLSGGEKVRLAFIKLMMNPGNLLLLDEPTTHLDIDSREILLKKLQEIDATIVFVSHDLYFINHLATSIIYFRKKEDIVNFSGNYDQYLDIYGEDNFPEETANKNRPQKISEKNIDHSIRKDLKNRLNKLKKEIEVLEKSVSELELEKQNCIDEFKNESSDFSELGIRIHKIEKNIDILMTAWENKSLELETMEKN